MPRSTSPNTPINSPLDAKLTSSESSDAEPTAAGVHVPPSSSPDHGDEKDPLSLPVAETEEQPKEN